MRNLRNLLAVTLLCALGTVAKAAPVDFQVVVIDPVPSNLIHPITADGFTYTFSACVSPGQVPAGTSYVGCFSGENATGHTLTSLEMFFPAEGTATCAKFGSNLDLFTSVTCTAVSGGFLFDYTGGNIPTANGHAPDDAEFNQDSIFTIAESGTDPSLMPVVTASFNGPVSMTPTPEPDSLVLLSTGLLAGGGLMLGNLRRRVFGERSR